MTQRIDGFGTPGSGEPPFTVRQSVDWGDMDAMGHVNNAVFLRWFENVRFPLFQAIGLNELHARERKGPILARATVDFLMPVTFPDELLLSASVSRMGNKSFTLRNRVWSTTHERMCAEGDAVIVMMDYESGQTIAIPGPIREGLERLAGAPGDG